MTASRLLKLPAKIIKYFESENIPFWTYVATFVSVIVMSQVLELVSQQNNLFNFASIVIAGSISQFALSYAVLILLLVIVIHHLCAIPIAKICRVLLSGTVLLLLIPIINLFGNGYDVIPLGARVVVSIFILYCFSYFRAKKISIIQSIIYTCLCYTVIFIWSISPTIFISILHALGFSVMQSEMMRAKLCLLILFFAGIWAAYLASPTVFSSILRNMKVSKLIFSILAVLFGAALAAADLHYNISELIYRDQEASCSVIFAVAALIYVMIFALLVELITDAGRDKYSVNADVDSSVLKNLAVVFMVLSLLYAVYVNAAAFMMISAMMSVTFVYHSQPFQFKRVPVISGIAISSMVLLPVFLGYILIMQTSAGFPLKLLWLYPAAMLLTLKGNIVWRKISGKFIPLCNAGLLAAIIYLFW